MFASGIKGAAAFDSRISVWRTAAQSITRITDVKIEFDTTVYDVLSEYDGVTNYRFVADADGFYTVKSVVGLAALELEKYLRISMRVNNVEKAYNDIIAVESGNPYIMVTKDVELSASEYIEIFLKHEGTASKNVVVGIGRCFMTVHRFA